MARLQALQNPADLLAVAGVVGAPQAIERPGTAPKMRNDAPPAALERAGGDRARIVARGAAFQPVEKREQRRCAVRFGTGPVEVDEIPVGGLPALAPPA